MRGRGILWWSLVTAACALFLGALAFMTSHAVPPRDSPEWTLSGRLASYFSDAVLTDVRTVTIVSSLALLLGILGFGLMMTAVARGPHPIPPVLVLGSLCGLCLTAYLLHGFDLSYAHFDGGLPQPGDGWYQQTLDPPSETTYYVPPWFYYADVLEQAALNLLVCILLFGLAAGVMRLPAVVAAAVLAATVGSPIVVAWDYGNASIFDLAAYDSAMAFPIHILAGSTALALILACRFLPPHSPREVLRTTAADLARPDRRPELDVPRQIVLAIGLLFFVVLLVHPSRLSGVHPLDWPMALARDATPVAIFWSGVTALGTALVRRRRPLLQCLAVGCLAGWAMVAGAAEDLSPAQAAVAGAAAGLIANTLCSILDRLKLVDPFGLIPAQLVCGALGAVLAGMPSDSDYSWDWTALIDQVGMVLVTGALGFTLGGVVALATWLTGTLWAPDPIRSDALQAPGPAAPTTPSN